MLDRATVFARDLLEETPLVRCVGSAGTGGFIVMSYSRFPMRRYGESQTFFDNIDALNPNVDTYRPTELPERQQELDEIYSALRPIEMGGTPINLLVYGETGQGKTVAVDLETTGFETWATEQDIDVTVVKVECKGLEKSYNALAHLVKSLRETRHGPGEDLPKGYQRKELLLQALSEIEDIGGTVIMILDEIDALGEDDYILYELPRATLENAKLSVIGITNDLTYTDNLDGDAKSSLGEDEVVFAPYDSGDLRSILSRRAAKALHDTGFSCDDCESPHCEHEPEEVPENLRSDVLGDDVIPLCAAFAAQETGDARRALKLINRAARFADDRGNDQITEDHVREAHEYLEEKAIVTGLQTLPIQKLVSLMALMYERVSDSEPGRTTELFNRYKKYCRATKTNTVSKKRFRDFMNDLENQGLIRKQKGRGQGAENKYWIDVDVDLVLEHLPDTGKTNELVSNLREKA